MTSLKEEAEVDEDEEESERDESPVASVFEVRTNNLVTEKPEPSPASLCRYSNVAFAISVDFNSPTRIVKILNVFVSIFYLKEWNSGIKGMATSKS